MANNVHGELAAAATVYASAARTATPDSEEYSLPAGARALTVTLDVTAVTATPALTVNIEGVDPVSGNTFLLLASAAVATTNAATAVRTYTVGPGLPATANVSANAPLPSKVRIRPVHGDADSITYSIGAFVS